MGKEADAIFLGAVSPGKPLRRNKLPKNDFVPPSKEAIERTWHLLRAYVLTYSPEILLRAIPCYPLKDAEASHIPRTPELDLPWKLTLGEEDLDSGVAKVAVSLKEHKDCWSLLRPGVIAFEDNANTRDPFAMPSEDDDEEDVSIPLQSVVAEHSWRLLEWFVELFEKDQELVGPDRSGMVEFILNAPPPEINPLIEKFSFCLLTQIKPPGSSHEPRSNVETIVDIIFICYAQTNQRHQGLGKRLTKLVRNPDYHYS